VGQAWRGSKVFDHLRTNTTGCGDRRDLQRMVAESTTRTATARQVKPLPWQPVKEMSMGSWFAGEIPASVYWCHRLTAATDARVLA
jgi:hypothetical protein